MSITEKYKELAYSWGRCESCGEWTTYHIDISENSILYFQDDLVSSLGKHLIRKVRGIDYIACCPDCMKDIVLPQLPDTARTPEG